MLTARSAYIAPICSEILSIEDEGSFPTKKITPIRTSDAITEQIILFDCFINYTFSVVFSPNNPVGRNNKTIIKITKVNASLNSEYALALINV